MRFTMARRISIGPTTPEKRSLIYPPGAIRMVCGDERFSLKARLIEPEFAAPIGDHHCGLLDPTPRTVLTVNES